MDQRRIAQIYAQKALAEGSGITIGGRRRGRGCSCCGQGITIGGRRRYGMGIPKGAVCLSPSEQIALQAACPSYHIPIRRKKAAPIPFLPGPATGSLLGPIVSGTGRRRYGGAPKGWVCNKNKDYNPAVSKSRKYICHFALPEELAERKANRKANAAVYSHNRYLKSTPESRRADRIRRAENRARKLAQSLGVVQSVMLPPEAVPASVLDIQPQGSGRYYRRGRGGLQIGGRRRRGGDAANEAAAVRSGWIDYVRRWAHSHGMRYSDALKHHGSQISADYRAGIRP